jgi:hypothetical protein
LIDIPVHQIVTVQVFLFILPNVIEEVFVVHVDGDDETIPNTLGNGGIKVQTRIIGPCDPEISGRSVSNHAIRVPFVVGRKNIRVVVYGGMVTVWIVPILRKRKVTCRTVHTLSPNGTDDIEKTS